MNDSNDHPRLQVHEIRNAIMTAIVAVAPDVADELPDLDSDVDLFEEFGLDSLDRLNIMSALATATGVEIPEDQYGRLTTIDQLTGALS